MQTDTPLELDTVALKLITREIAADLETPVSTYLKLSQDGPSFLLESVTGGEQLGRYSFIGLQPHAAYVINGHTVACHHGPGLRQVETVDCNNPIEILRSVLLKYNVVETPFGLPRFVGGLVGYLSYDAVRFFEPTLDPPLHELPDGILLLTDTLVVFDHVRGHLVAIASAHGDSQDALSQATARLDAIEALLADPLPAPWRTTKPVDPETHQSHQPNQFETIVKRAKEYIAAGDVFQVVLSQRLSQQTHASPFAIYRALRRMNPSPYMFFFDFGNIAGETFHIIGASPEMHVRLENEQAALRPIAGTRPRGQNNEQDTALEDELLDDPKECAEHMMLVDLGRNDLGRVCEYGSIAVTELMIVERYSHVMHIVSQIEGRLRPEFDAFDLLAATFPAGTVSGAPKIRAMEIIAELEGSARGPYAGIIGYVGYDGSMDTCITLRTLYMQRQRVTVQAGAGIVADSNPLREYEETVAKARAVALAVEEAERQSIT